MKTHLLLIANLLLGNTVLMAAETKPGSPIDAKAAFAQLKTLVGEWQADSSMGKVHLSYELIAGGTSLVERETGEQTPSMMTVYHLDGGRLLLTHYCMAGNQPRMQAQKFNPETGDLEFRFLDATNLTSPTAGHMHNVRIRFVDNDHLESEWQFYENGQKKMAENAQYTRVR